MKPGGAAEVRVKALDSWAVMAWLRDEPAAQRIDDLWSDAAAGKLRLIISAINVGEIFYLAARWRSRADAELILRQLHEMPLDIRPAVNALVWEAARLKAQHRISFADAFAVATAVREGAPLVTGDPEMKGLADKGVVTLDWIRN